MARDWQHAYSLAISGQVVTAFTLTAPLVTSTPKQLLPSSPTQATIQN